MSKKVYPGSSIKMVNTENYNCHNCGYEIEVFSDEIEIKCPKCKHKYLRDKIVNRNNK